MAIVKMSNFNLLIMKRDQSKLLHEMQRFGNVHFKGLTPSEDGFLREVTSENMEQLEKRRDIIKEFIKEVESYEKSQRWLVGHRVRKKLILDDLNTSTMTFDELEKKALEINIESIIGSMDETEPLHETGHSDKVLYEIEPWENNKLKDRVLVEIRDATPIIGTVQETVSDEFAEEIRTTGGIYASVSKNKEGEILFLLKPSLDQVENAGIMAEKYRMKRRSAKAVRMNREVLQFKQKIDKMIGRRHRTDGSLEKLAKRKLDLMIYYEYLENLLLRQTESRKFLQTDSMIMIEGWFPQKMQEEFTSIVEGTCSNLHVLKTEMVSSDSEEAPVQLHNNKFTSAFESITKMYATPKYNELDPTPVFAPFYLLFFGMMLADVGYGLLMMVCMFAALKLVSLKPSTQGMVRFLLYLSFSTILWGFIYGSFFGSMIPMKALINTNTEYNRVLIMALIFGIIHLLVALGVKGFIHIRSGHPFYALFDVGFWYMTLLGAIALGLSIFMPEMGVNQRILWGVMIGGMVGIILTNGRSAKTIPGKMASGLYSLYGLTNYVSDIVSYSRLMALGLAGGSIGIAINMIVAMLAEIKYIGIIAGAGVFIGGHMFNLFISGLSSYVHSSRLIYVEFFSKFYTGGGETFTPFRAKHTYINII